MVTCVQRNEALLRENRNFKSQQLETDTVMRDAVVKCKAQEKLAEHLQGKVQVLEASLSHVVREFDAERCSLVEQGRDENKAALCAAITPLITESITTPTPHHAQLTRCSERGDRLQRQLDLKTAELKRVKRLARTILEQAHIVPIQRVCDGAQRSEVEAFFVDALGEVKQEIATGRAQYVRESQLAYRQQLHDAAITGAPLPKIRTFNRAPNRHADVPITHPSSLIAAPMLSSTTLPRPRRRPSTWPLSTSGA